MKQQVEVPRVGESVSGGILAQWHKSDGDVVEQGEPLFELETDKATMSIPAPTSGRLSITVSTGTEVEIAQVVAEIDDAVAPDASSRSAPAAGGPGAAAAGGAADGANGAATANAAAAGESFAGRASAGASALQTGAGPGTPSAAAHALSPAVRRVVAETGVDPAAVAGTGKGGRLTKGDVIAAASTAAGASQQPTARSESPAPGTDQERRAMTTVRKRIAENLVRSKQTSAHLTTFNEVDMSAVMELRARHKDAFERKHGVRLGFMSFFLKAAQRALVAYPEVNAFIDGTEIVYNRRQHIGVALSSEVGLIVPVVRDVQEKGFAQIEREIADFIARAKERRIMPDEFAGGTFTVSNGGVFGSMLSTPIPNPPQTGVLGMHTIQKRPVVVDDQIVIRPMMYLALTYDHRLIDGREAIGFLLSIKAAIEDPAALLLEL